MHVEANSEPPGERNAPQRDQAYTRLRQMLILHQAPEGKRLNEESWAKRLEVNRAALREAFARLEAEGLIEKGTLPGYFVPTLSRDDVAEIVEVRIMLEGGAIDRICRRGLNTPKHLAELIDNCEQLAELTGSTEYPAVAQADRCFHESLVRSARNRRLVLLYQRAPLPIIPPQKVAGDEWMTRLQLTVQEHRRVLDFILEGDVPQAQSMLRKHLRERSLMPVRDA